MKTAVYHTTTEKKWVMFDAKDVILGDLAVRIANFLRGKDSATFTAHLVPARGVVVINAEHIKVTGKKEVQKMYRRHSGYMGNMKEFNLGSVRATNPAMILEKAVYGMLPRNKLRQQMMKNLRVFAGVEHDLGAQQPTLITV